MKARRVGLLGMLGVFIACASDKVGGPNDHDDGGSSGTGNPRVASVTVSPSADTLVSLGETLGLAVVVRDSAGATIANITVSWFTSNETVVRVDSVGEVTGLGNGTATITANAGAVSGMATLVVDQRVAQVVLDAPQDTVISLRSLVTEGLGVQFAATPADALGNAVGEVTLSWASTDALVASVDPETGLVTAGAPGEVLIQADANGVIGEQLFVVTPAPPRRAVFTLSSLSGPPPGIYVTDSTLSEWFPAYVPISDTTVREPDWSPVADRFVFVVEYNAPACNRALAIVNIDGSGFTELVLCRGGGFERFSVPRWSPDGTRIAYSYERIASREC